MTIVINKIPFVATWIIVDDEIQLTDIRTVGSIVNIADCLCDEIVNEIILKIRQEVGL